MATTPQAWQVPIDQLVIRNESATSGEAKLVLGGAILAVAYYWTGGGKVLRDVLTMAGGVLIAGGVRDIFWPPYRPLPPEYLRYLKEGK